MRIIENSLIARLISKKLGKPMAFTPTTTIHLYGVSKEVFLEQISWVRHEQSHISDYRSARGPLGKLCYWLSYILALWAFGYNNNPYERLAEDAARKWMY